MIWADQSLSEGLRIGMDKGNVNSILQLLQSLQVGVIDVRVKDWHKDKMPLLSRQQQNQIRGRISGTAWEVALAYKLGFKKIMIACRLSPGEGLSKKLHEALLAAQKLNMNIGLCIENASVFSIEELEGLWRDVSTMGATTFIYSDGDSLLNPLSISRILTLLVQSIPLGLEFHGHNAYGLATANAVGAMQAGVKCIAAAVAGVGRQGHAAIEEVIMIRKQLYGEEGLQTMDLAHRCSQILSGIGVELSGTKAIIGQNIFAHESGIHVDGVLKEPQLYEPFSPEEVGLSRKLIIGKHSGTASIQAKFRHWNVTLSALDTKKLLKKVRNLAVRKKKSVDDDILWQLYQSRVVQ